MKKAYLWFFVWQHSEGDWRVPDLLLFSSPDKFREVVGQDSNYHDVNSENILVEVQVPLEFDDWDFCPDNY
jgi:hypothetical protein